MSSNVCVLTDPLSYSLSLDYSSNKDEVYSSSAAFPLLKMCRSYNVASLFMRLCRVLNIQY